MNELGEIRERDYTPKKDKSLRFITLAIFAFFIGTGLIIGFFPITFISLFSVTKFIVLFAVIGFLIPLRYYAKHLHFIKYEAIIFNTLGMGPFLTGLFLCLNFLFSSNSKTSKYEFNGFKTNTNTVELLILDNTPELPQEAFVCPPEILHHMQGNVFKITTADGLFGFGVIKEREIIAKED
ncbi:MAG: hypothetical protein H6587_03135 [Flavobacteriales bacterium]|nr:hypothetical protein [Flavobacteriales bacterium]MCB9363542.1 hypothetical protein [Flavobacteriales bacterium]